MPAVSAVGTQTYFIVNNVRDFLKRMMSNNFFYEPLSERDEKRINCFLKIAQIVSTLSNCASRQVGAILVREKMIISTGTNGTPKGVLNCDEGGCDRCNASSIPSGEQLDKCICVHAEENSVIQAAYNGISTKDSMLFCTHKPCQECVKILINAGVRRVFYINDYNVTYDDALLKTIQLVQWDIK